MDASFIHPVLVFLDWTVSCYGFSLRIAPLRLLAVHLMFLILVFCNGVSDSIFYVHATLKHFPNRSLQK